MSDQYCPECDEKLYETECRSPFDHPDQTEICWICNNKSCDNYDEVVLTEGDLEE